MKGCEGPSRVSVVMAWMALSRGIKGAKTGSGVEGAAVISGLQFLMTRGIRARTWKGVATTGGRRAAMSGRPRALAH